MALKNFAREVGAGKRKRILLVRDRAGWHTAKKKLRVPEGIHILNFYTLALTGATQPSERLWALSDEAVANRHFERIEDRGSRRGAGESMCVALHDQPELIRSYIRYHW